MDMNPFFEHVAYDVTYDIHATLFRYTIESQVRVSGIRMEKLTRER